MTALRAYGPGPAGERRVDGMTREELIKAYTPKVRLLANLVSAKIGAQVDFDDLLHAGMVGLLEAIDRFDESRGARFSTFAEFRIRGAMLDSLRELDLLSRTAREKANRVKRAISELQGKLGREPEQEEIASALGVDMSGYHQLLDDAKGITLYSMEETHGDPEGRPLVETLCEEDAPSALDHMADANLREAMKDAVKKLPERLRQVVLLYYFQELNLKEIGRVLGLSESRVCQLHSEAILRLRSRAEKLTAA